VAAAAAADPPPSATEMAAARHRPTPDGACSAGTCVRLRRRRQHSFS